MKKIWCLLVCIATLLTMLSSCGSFFAEPTVEIDNIDSVSLADGQTKIIITYKDPSIDPLEFLIPAGKVGDKGTDGAGVASIDYKHVNKQTEIIITYTDNRKETIFAIPDGMYATGSEVKYDEEQELSYIEFTYSDGTKSGPFYIPTPEKGDQGNGISNNYVESEDDLYIYYVLEFDDGTTTTIEIPKGVGIVDIVAGYPVDDGTGEGEEGEDEGETEEPDEVQDENNENYVITIYYTNGSVGTMEFQRPTKWYSGITNPANNMGINGDYYLDESAQIIYRKIGGRWVSVITLGDGSNPVTVTFDMNAAGDSSASMNGEYIYTFEMGECFASRNYYNGNIPIPTRDGYIFDGWYAKKVVDPIVNSRFTDLTAISSDIVLYAKWIPET